MGMPIEEKRFILINLNVKKNRIQEILDKQPEFLEMEYNSDDYTSTSKVETIKKPFKWGK